MSDSVIYTVLESGIHKFVWLKNTRDAVYEHAGHYQVMNENAKSGATLLLLIDLRQSGAPPFQLLGDANKKSGSRKDVHYRTAYISDDSIVPVLMQNFIMANRVSGDRQFFKADEEQQAIDWLLDLP